MQKYIYGNAGHKGFAYFCSDHDFYRGAKGAERIKALLPLQRYDGIEGHSYWMVTTDLGISGERERIYAQISGPDPLGDAIYMQGYMTDPEETSYGAEMLRLLRLKFQNLEDAMTEAEGSTLCASRLENLPADETLRPARVDRDLMQNILLSLLTGRRVILRLPETGADAERSSRELLLTIYQRLPYECRRLNGFLTGTSSSGILNRENPLPPSITTVLMDGDADISNLRTDRYRLFIDLADSQKSVEPIDRNRNAAHLKLLDFLVDESAENLDEFFQFCKKFADAENKGGGLKLSQYSLLLDMFDMGRVEVTSPRIRMWAATFYESTWSSKTKENFYHRVAQAIPPQQMQLYLTETLSSFEELNSFGQLGDQDKRHIKAHQSQEEILDENEALTLSMTEELLTRGEYPQEARENIVSALCNRFTELAHREHPCLVEQHPTQNTISKLDQLNFPLEDRTANGPIFKVVRSKVYQNLQENRLKVKDCYHRQYEEQQHSGMTLINQWPTANWAANDLEEMYRQLRKFYLWEELLEGNGQGSWNRSIADWILATSTCQEPRTLTNIQLALEHTSRNRELFQENGGHLTPVQTQKLDENVQSWSEILALNECSCNSIKEMLNLFDKIDAAALESQTDGQLRSKYADMIAVLNPSVEEICLATPELIQRSQNDPLEKKLFQKIIAASVELCNIPEGMELNQIKSRLKKIQELEEAGLTDGLVWFAAWQEQDHAEALLGIINALSSYQGEKSGPKLKSEEIRRWALTYLQDNTALMFLMARVHPSMREEIIKILAQKNRGVSAEQIQELYLTGCPTTLLKRGAGDRTSEAWEAAVERAFPSWCDLPSLSEKKPEPQPNPAGKILSTVEPVLLGLAALVPSLTLGLAGDISAMGCGMAAAVQAVLGIGCAVSGLALREKEQKRLLAWLAASVSPGFIALFVQLILTLM